MVLIRQKVPVTPNHVVAHVPDPRVDHSLVEPLCGAVATERMAEDMPAVEFLPLRILERVAEMVMSFAGCQRDAFGTIFLAPVAFRPFRPGSFDRFSV